MAVSNRLAPGVRITLLADPKAASGEPLKLDGRIVSFSFEEGPKKADQVSLQLDNYDLALFERDDLVGGATLEVSWGYPGNMAPPRRVVVKKLKGFQTLTLEGHATSVLMNQQVKTRAWSDKTRSDVVREVAAEHGFEGDFAEVGDTQALSGAIDSINQTAETDARFLKRLAAREGFEFFVDDEGLHWRARKQTDAPVRVFTWFSDPSAGDVISLDAESDVVRRAGRVEVRGRDPLAKVTIAARANSSTVERSTLGDVLEVVDPQNGSTSLLERNATSTVHATAAATPETVRHEADARFAQAERETIKLAMQVVGDPTLRAKQVVELRGVSGLLSGKYYVTEAKHTISASGYVVDLKLTRDAGGQRRAATTSKAQAQGGQPNRTAPASGSAMTPIEKIDPQDGSSRVEYRRDGRVIGAEDPEAGMSRAS
jgi:phage protein D